MIDKIKKYAKDNKDELLIAGIILVANITTGAIASTIGYKIAARDLELVGMTTHHDDTTDKIIGLTVHRKDGQTISYSPPKEIIVNN